MHAQTQTLKNETRSTLLTGWPRLHRWAGVSALILLVYALATMVILVVIGGQPLSAQEGFTMLQENRLAALLRLDLLSILIMPLYFPLFLSLYQALKPTEPALAALAALFVFIGVTLFLATPSVFSWLALSDRFAAADTEALRAQILAAGEAILASDMWHGSGAVVGGLLLQSGTLLVSVLMLGSPAFSRWTGWVGILTHGLDLIHIPLMFFAPTAGILLMAVAGPLYLAWFPLVARDLFRLARRPVDD